MKRKIIHTKFFSKALGNFYKKRQLLEKDFNEFKKDLVENPDLGDMIPGTGGVRKTRLKSASKGKSGGFRVCYYFLVEDEEIYLLMLYGKNVQENLTMEEKKMLKQLVRILKEETNG